MAGAAAASLAFSVSSALATPAWAASTPITTESFVAQLSAAADATQAALLSGGGASTVSIPGLVDTPATVLAVDPATKRARAALPYDLSGLAELSDLEDGLPLFVTDTCEP